MFHGNSLFCRWLCGGVLLLAVLPELSAALYQAAGQTNDRKGKVCDWQYSANVDWTYHDGVMTFTLTNVVLNIQWTARGTYLYGPADLLGGAEFEVWLPNENDPDTNDNLYDLFMDWTYTPTGFASVGTTQDFGQEGAASDPVYVTIPAIRTGAGPTLAGTFGDGPTLLPSGNAESADFGDRLSSGIGTIAKICGGILVLVLAVSLVLVGVRMTRKISVRKAA